MLAQTIGFLGAGQMARALARGLVDAQLVRPQQILAADPSPVSLEQFTTTVCGAQIVRDNPSVVSGSDVIFLAVKPQQVADVAQTLGGVAPDKLVVSVAAGIALQQLCQLLGTQRVVRVMPNTPCLVGQGASAYALGPAVTDEDGRLVGQLLDSVGTSFRLDESLLDAVTGLSGSGPAFVFVLIEALSDGGVRMGLPRDTATALAAHTVRGSAELLLASGEHPGVLKDRVASPGGTTIAGLHALEEHGLRAALIAAVQAAAERSQELGSCK